MTAILDRDVEVDFGEQACIRAGAATLDAMRPGWRDEIDVESLDIMDGQRCVLGQLFGSYGAGIASMQMHATAPVTVSSVAAFGGRVSTSAWRDYLAGKF